MARNLDTDLLRTFVTVADTGSMTVAAKALHLTQGAVSQQVKRLEDTLGCALFARARSGLRLTPAGERLIGKARRLLLLNDEILAEMTDRTFTGRVRLGVPYDLIGTALAPAIKSYAEACPNVEVSLVCASSPDLAEKLGAGEIELAVIEEPATARSAGECLAIERLVWSGAKGGAAHLKRPLPISMVADTCAFRPAVIESLHRHGIEWRTVFENGSIEATSATVRTDLAITTWLASTVPSDLDILGPDSGLPPLPSFAINLHLAPHAGTMPAATELAQHIRANLVRQRPAA